MGLIIRGTLLIGTLVSVYFFMMNRVPEWKNNLVESINPQVREGKIIDTLDKNLNQLSGNISGKVAGASDTEKIIEESMKLLSELSEINNENSGIAKQAMTKIISTVTGGLVSPSNPATPCKEE